MFGYTSIIRFRENLNFYSITLRSSLNTLKTKDFDIKEEEVTQLLLYNMVLGLRLPLFLFEVPHN